MTVSSKFQADKGIDGVAIDLLQSFVVMMEPCSREVIALSLETIASTFQCKVPDDFGLSQYFKILQQYPKFCIEQATTVLLTEYKYPRLPVPKDFIDICEPMYTEHSDWLLKTVNRFHKLEIYKQYQQKTNQSGTNRTEELDIMDKTNPRLRDTTAMEPNYD